MRLIRFIRKAFPVRRPAGIPGDVNSRIPYYILFGQVRKGPRAELQSQGCTRPASSPFSLDAKGVTGKSLYRQAKGRLWPASVFHAECTVPADSVSLLLNTTQQEGCLGSLPFSNHKNPAASHALCRVFIPYTSISLYTVQEVR